jgi:hypothetical protein
MPTMLTSESSNFKMSFKNAKAKTLNSSTKIATSSSESPAEIKESSYCYKKSSKNAENTILSMPTTLFNKAPNFSCSTKSAMPTNAFKKHHPWINQSSNPSLE